MSVGRPTLTGSTHVTRTILARRSIRSGFGGSPLPEAVIEEIVACGLAAPSSKNSMPWRLHVVTRRDLLVTIADLVAEHHRRDSYVPHDPVTGQPLARYASTVGPSATVLASVPLAVIVENVGPFSGGLSGLLAADDQARRSAVFGYALEMVGVGAAIENMWLAACALGLQAVLLGDVAIAESEIASRLGLVGDLIGALAIGPSDHSPRPPMDLAAMPDLDRVVRH